MPRPKKKGLDYFPLDADFFSDQKVKILKARYGADGVTIYLYLLCEIYKNGYYINADEDFVYVMTEDLNMGVDKVMQVLTFLLERSMFDEQLFQSDAVLTSAGIQRRYQVAVRERAKKTPIEVGRFWILKKNETEPFIKCALFEGFSQNNGGFSQNNRGFSREESLKESKVNNIYIYDNPELDKIFRMYISMRNNNQKEPLTEDQVNMLKEELYQSGETDEERIAICKKAFTSNWKGFYPLRKKKKEDAGSKNLFHNFNQREGVDYDALEKKLAYKNQK